MSKQNSAAAKEPRFTPEQLARSEKFGQYGYILRAVLDSKKTYTVEQAEKAIAPFI